MNILPYIKILVLALSINAVESLSADHPPLDKNNFKEYVKALEEGDEDAFRTKFYHENFSTMFGDKLINRNDFIDFEKSLHESVKFNFNVQEIVSDTHGIAVNVFEEITVLNDTVIPIAGKTLKGEKWKLHLIVFYKLKDGKISTIDTNFISIKKLN